MAFNPADVVEITGNHPDLEKISLQVKKGEEFTFDLGGVITEEDTDGVTGSGEPVYTMTNTPWRVEGVVMWDRLTRDEMKVLKQYGASPLEATWTFSMLDGSILGATGKVVGNTTGTNKSMITTVWQGGGTLEPQN